MSRPFDDRALAGSRSFGPGPDPALDGRPGAQMAASVVLPGAAALRRRTWFGLAALLIGVGLPVALVALVVVRRDHLFALALSEWFLVGVLVVAGLGIVSRVGAVAEVANWFRGRPGVAWKAAVALLVVLVVSIPVVWAGMRVNDARSAVAAIFDGDGAPVYESSAIDPADGDIHSILLFGGDAGPGRWGMRTDTMILVQIHESSGRAALVSIPRNLTGLRFPPGTPLADLFPEPAGFDDLANAVFTYVNTRPELVEHYGERGPPEAIALAGAIGYSLNVSIDDYALVNMLGFAQIVDALGGVTVELARPVVLAGDVIGGRDLPGSVGPGTVEMDGTTALAFVRSRAEDSDYQRMERQRVVLAALGSQIRPADAAGSLGTLTGVLGDSLRTSLSGAELATLLDVLGDDAAIRESVGLVPPLIAPGSPDYAEIRQIVRAVRRAIVSGQPSGY